MKKAVLVFDALTNQLKKERAHQERYGKNEDKMKELEKLLEVTSLSSDTEEKVTVANVRQLRTSLSPIRQDMLYETGKTCYTRSKRKSLKLLVIKFPV